MGQIVAGDNGHLQIQTGLRNDGPDRVTACQGIGSRRNRLDRPEISKSIPTPTIGIGASPGCDGQILVINDMLGRASDYAPKFVKRYAEHGESTRAAVARYAEEVRERTFPGPEHVFN